MPTDDEIIEQFSSQKQAQPLFKMKSDDEILREFGALPQTPAPTFSGFPLYREREALDTLQNPEAYRQFRSALEKSGTKPQTQFSPGPRLAGNEEVTALIEARVRANPSAAATLRRVLSPKNFDEKGRQQDYVVDAEGNLIDMGHAHERLVSSTAAGGGPGFVPPEQQKFDVNRWAVEMGYAKTVEEAAAKFAANKEERDKAKQGFTAWMVHDLKHHPEKPLAAVFTPFLPIAGAVHVAEQEIAKSVLREHTLAGGAPPSSESPVAALVKTAVKQPWSDKDFWSSYADNVDVGPWESLLYEPSSWAMLGEGALKKGVRVGLKAGLKQGVKAGAVTLGAELLGTVTAPLRVARFGARGVQWLARAGAKELAPITDAALGGIARGLTKGTNSQSIRKGFNFLRMLATQGEAERLQYEAIRRTPYAVVKAFKDGTINFQQLPAALKRAVNTLMASGAAEEGSVRDILHDVYQSLRSAETGYGARSKDAVRSLSASARAATRLAEARSEAGRALNAVKLAGSEEEKAAALERLRKARSRVTELEAEDFRLRVLTPKTAPRVQHARQGARTVIDMGRARSTVPAEPEAVEARRMSPLEELAARSEEVPPSVRSHVVEADKLYGSMPAADAPKAEWDAYLGAQSARHAKVQAYMEQHPDVSWDEAWDALFLSHTPTHPTSPVLDTYTLESQRSVLTTADHSTLATAPVHADEDVVALLDQIAVTSSGKQGSYARALRERALRALSSGKPVPLPIRRKAEDLLSRIYAETLGTGAVGQELPEGTGALKLVSGPKGGVQLELGTGLVPSDATDLVTRLRAAHPDVGIDVIRPGELGVVNISDASNVIGPEAESFFDKLVRISGLTPGESGAALNPAGEVADVAKRVHTAASEVWENMKHAYRSQISRRFEAMWTVDPAAAAHAMEAQVGRSLGWHIADLRTNNVLRGLTDGEAKSFLKILQHDSAEVDIAAAGRATQWEDANHLYQTVRRLKVTDPEYQRIVDGLGQQGKKKREVLSDLLDARNAISKRKPRVAFEGRESDVQQFILSPEEYDRILSNPNIRAAIQRHKQTVQQEVLDLRTTLRESLGSTLKTKEEGRLGTFISFVPQPEKRGIFSARPVTKSMRDTVFANVRTYSAPSYMDNYRDVARAMYGEVYSALQHNKFLKHLLKPVDEGGYAVIAPPGKGLNWVMDNVGSAVDSAGHRYPVVEFNGKKHRLVQVGTRELLGTYPKGVVSPEVSEAIDLNVLATATAPEKAAKIRGTKIYKAGSGIWLPEPIARDLVATAKRATKPELFGEGGWYPKVNGFLIGSQLATPAEGVMHAYRILGMLARQVEGGSLVERVFKGFPAVAKASAFKQILNPFDGEGQLIARWMAETGAFPTRAYSEAGAFERIGDWILRQAERVPGVGGALKTGLEVPVTGVFKMRSVLFGSPGESTVPLFRHVMGFDTRVRVVAGKKWLRAMGYRNAMEAAEEFARNPEFRLAFQEHLNKFGQYHNAVLTDTISTIHRTGVLPFIRTQIATIPNEVAQAFGGGFPKVKKGGVAFSKAEKAVMWLETLYRGTIGRAVGLSVANKAISGKWPWENDPGHWLDLNLGSQGEGAEKRDVYLTSQALDPGQTRGMRVGGIEAALSTVSGQGTVADFLQEQARLLQNQTTNLVGPLYRKLYEVGTGKRLYRTRGGGSIPFEETHATTAKTQLASLKRAVMELNPIASKISTSLGLTPEPTRPAEGGFGVAQDVGDFLGLPVRTGRTRDELDSLRLYTEQRAQQKAISEMVNDALRTHSKEDLSLDKPFDPESFFMQEVKRRGFEADKWQPMVVEAEQRYIGIIKKRALEAVQQRLKEEQRQGK